jgi:CRP/FNR family cyclic AMP-dependent transcriptional regulator
MDESGGPLFAGLTEDQLVRIKGLLRHRAFPAGANIISIEQPGEVVYIILEGTVKIHVEQADGSDVILAILGPGEVVGEMSPVEGLGRSANVVTLEPTKMAWLDRAAFREWLQNEPMMGYNLTRIMSRRLRLANAQIQALAALDVYGRVARQIVAFAREYGEARPDGSIYIPIRLTQSDMAGLVGASRVSVNKVLVYYKERKYISVDQTFRITVHNQAALAQRSE